MIIQTADWMPVVVTDDLSQFSNANGGYALYNPTVAKLLTDAPVSGTSLPGHARHAVITVRTNPIRWRADGTAPTAAVGQFLAAGETMVVDNSPNWLRRFQFIDTAAGASEVNVTYFY